MSAPQFRNTPNPPMSAPHVHVHSDVHHGIHSDDEADGMPAECRRRRHVFAHVFAYSPTQKNYHIFQRHSPKTRPQPPKPPLSPKNHHLFMRQRPPFYATVSSILCNGVLHFTQRRPPFDQLHSAPSTIYVFLPCFSTSHKSDSPHFSFSY